MSVPLLNTAIAMQNTLGSAKTITAISKAAEAVVTGTHDFSAGDYVVITGVAGMTEINNRAVRVLSVSTTVSFVCEGLDSSAFSTYTSGGTVKKVTAFYTFDNVISFGFPEPAPTELDATTVHEKTSKVLAFGLDEAVKITLPILSDPVGATMVAVRAAAAARTGRVFRTTLQSGAILLFNAYVAGGRGLDGAAGDLAKGTISLTTLAPEQWFSS